MSDRPRFRGSAASFVLLAWIHLTACLLLVEVAVDPRELSEFVGLTGAPMLFSPPLGLIGWRFYGWWLMMTMAGIGFALLAAAVLTNR